ncbi:MAG: tyrosine-type recombinase/integrase [Thiohalospira sp.]
MTARPRPSSTGWRSAAASRDRCYWPCARTVIWFEGRYLSDQTIYHILRRLQQEAGTPPFTPHDLRRAYGGDLLDAGAGLATVQKLMDHAKPDTTSSYDRRGERAKEHASGMRHTPYFWQ